MNRKTRNTRKLHQRFVLRLLAARSRDLDRKIAVVVQRLRQAQACQSSQ
jgi:hypothetical protein